MVDSNVLMRHEELKELKKANRKVGHENKNEQLVQVGGHIDKTQKGYVWRHGPAPEFQTMHLE